MSSRDGLPLVSSDRAVPVASSRLARHDQSHGGNDEEKQGLSDAIDAGGDHEDDELLPKEKLENQPEPKGSFITGLLWMVVNTLATIGIVSTTTTPLPRSQLTASPGLH